LDRTFTRLGTAVADLDAAWQDRLTEAEGLLAAGRNAWAIATGLYALETRLKVMVCKKLDLEGLPKAFETHDLDGLLLLAGLSRRIQRRSAAPVKRSWEEIRSLLRRLNELRYGPDARWSRPQATTFFSQFRDAPNGVLPWLARQR
jgi:hypothetical protein